MEEELSNLEQTRLEKVNRLRAQGIEPYPAHACRPTQPSRRSRLLRRKSRRAGSR